MTSSIRKRNIRRVLVVGAIVACAAGSVPTIVNANYVAAKPAHVSIQAASFGLGVSDDDNSGTIDLAFNNLAPVAGLNTEPLFFYVQNNSSVPATVNLGSTIHNPVWPANVADLNLGYIRVGAWEVNAGQSVGLAAINNLPAGGWDLGHLNPGEKKKYEVFVKMDPQAGTEYAGAKFEGDLDVTLTAAAQ